MNINQKIQEFLTEHQYQKKNRANQSCRKSNIKWWIF